MRTEFRRLLILQKAPPAVWTATGLLSILIIGLLLTFPLGIGGDYPNHLARTYIEGWLAGSTTLGEYYALRVSFIPDLTMDLIIPWLSHLIGIYPAGAVVCALAILLGPIAGVLISRRLHGGNESWLPLIGFTAIFNLNLEFGFINFLAASGLALLAFYFWIGANADWRRTLVFAPVGLFLVINHALGFLLFGYIVLLWEGAKFYHKERGSAATFFTGLFVRDGVAFLPGIAFLALSVMGASDLDKAIPTANIFAGRNMMLFAPFRFFSDSNAVLTALVSFLFLVVGFIIGLSKRVIKIDPDMAIVCAGLCILVLVMPVHFLGIWGLHFRFGPALIILCAASIKFNSCSDSVKAIGGVGLLTLLGLQFLNAIPNIIRIDDNLQSIRRAAADLPKGALVLPVSDGLADLAIAGHGVALSVIEAGGYVPNLFTNTSPVDVVETMKPLHASQAPSVSVQDLVAGMDKNLVAAANGHWSRDFYFNWPETFTHILYMRAPGTKGLDLERLCVFATGIGFELYTIRQDHTGDCSARPPGTG